MATTKRNGLIQKVPMDFILTYGYTIRRLTLNLRLVRSIHDFTRHLDYVGTAWGQLLRA